MLRNLSVSNLSVVERAEVEFDTGLNVLTGETGAGKSVLMGALELVLGGRADTGVIREGASSAEVAAEFDLAGVPSARVKAILDEADIPCDGASLVVRRSVGANCGGRVRVNDTAATVALLKRLGAALVDIHGPRANQSILEEGFQRTALDSFGAVASDAYARAWRALVEVRTARAALEADVAGGVEAETEMLRYQTDELQAAELSSDDEDLAARHAAAAHAEEIAEAANEITEKLGGDGGVETILASLAPRFAEIARRLPEASGWASEATELTARAEELSRTVADAASRLDLDPAAFEEMDRRLGVVNRLKRKYACATVADLLALADRKAVRLDELEHREERLAELAKREDAALGDVKKAGAALTAARRKAADRLAKAVTKGLGDLGFASARFSVALEAREPDATGCDRVVYVFRPNPGEGARPLAEIASSGETARVMLALKGALAEHDATDVLVFDEIDANIGGEVGAAVGARMRSVARAHQVIAITHLPQSAVWGERHLVVSKSVSGGRTRTAIAEATGEARVKEIARMLGGERSTSVVLEHARQMLAKAQGE